MSSVLLNHKKIIDVVKYRWAWFALSLLLIVPGIVAMVYSMVTYPTHAPLLVGIDFTGGTISQYSVEKAVDNDEISKIREKLEAKNIANPIIQVLNQIMKEKQKL
jgi:preprotein translocase subunit SecF